LGYKKPQSGLALCGVFFRHIWAGGLAAQALISPPKRRIQPERYAKYNFEIIEKACRPPWRHQAKEDKTKDHITLDNIKQMVYKNL
jgi:hypothetical protein